MPPTDERLALIHDWVSAGLRLAPRAIEPASSDASFRRYFRVFSAPSGRRSAPSSSWTRPRARKTFGPM